MRFSCAPQERGGHTNKGNKHELTIVEEPAAQHGQRPYAEWRQRQLQTLVRRRLLKVKRFACLRQSFGRHQKRNTAHTASFMPRPEDPNAAALVYSGQDSSVFQAAGSKLRFVQSLVGRYHRPIRLIAHRR
jgi:hypothetical protein